NAVQPRGCLQAETAIGWVRSCPSAHALPELDEVLPSRRAALVELSPAPVPSVGERAERFPLRPVGIDHGCGERGQDARVIRLTVGLRIPVLRVALAK